MKSSKDSQGNLNNYQSSMAIDGRTDTWWCEDEKDDGAGVRFTMDLPGWEVHGIRLVPGYDKVRQDRWGDRWYINNRIAQIEIQTFDLEGRTVDRQTEWLEDRRLWHEVKLRTPATLSSIELRIVSVHPSTIAQGRRTRWKDSGIAEIELLVPKGSTGERSGSSNAPAAQPPQAAEPAKAPPKNQVMVMGANGTMTKIYDGMRLADDGIFDGWGAVAATRPPGTLLTHREAFWQAGWMLGNSVDLGGGTSGILPYEKEGWPHHVVNVAEDDTLNIRNGPSPRARKVGEAAPGSLLYAVEKQGGGHDHDEEPWVEVRNPSGVAGYVNGRYLDRFVEG